jgi:putative oxidoreductase
VNFRYTFLDRINAVITRLLARYSVELLRISLGLVFLGFGGLKFFPGLSPAADLAGETMEKLTLGLIPGGVGIVLVAMVETAIGFFLITGKYLRLGLALLGVAMVGILSPLVLLPDELFARPYEPTLEGQYVLKDIVLLAAGLVVAASVKLGHSVTDRD